MVNKVTRGFILMLVAAYWTQVGADDLQEINCKDTDKDGQLCPRNREARDAHDFEEDFHQRSYIATGVSVTAFIVIAVIIIACVFCACCPFYKYRNRGAVYNSATTPQQPVTIYQQPPHNLQQTNTHVLLQPSHPGFVYSTATTPQQPVTIYQQLPYNPQQINTQPFVEPPYPGFVYSPGHALPQTPNAPHYSAVTEHQRNPGIGHYAGAPEEPPAYFQTSPQNKNMNTNFTSK